jgi:hypothetical protein
MAEYVLGADENRGEVARRLLAQAGDRADQVTWIPRADVPGGGVYLIPDDMAEQASAATATAKAGGEYPYDGNQEGDPERREADLAAMQEAEGDEEATEAAAADEELPARRRRKASAPEPARPASDDTDQ